MAKRPFIRKQKRKKHGVTFWDNEYSKGGHLALSDEASDDLKKFTRFLERTTGKAFLNPTTSVLDLGCGNGRNLAYLAQQFGVHGIGYDTSSAAIKQAKVVSQEYQLTYEVRSIAERIPLNDQSQTLVLDMMSSHFLNKEQRLQLRNEVFRVLKPGGWLFMKTFLRDKDVHTRRLLEENATNEEGTYTHPVLGVAEHAYSEEELTVFLEEKFVVHKVYRSHKHISKGKARKRRTMAIYAQKSQF